MLISRTSLGLLTHFLFFLIGYLLAIDCRRHRNRDHPFMRQMALTGHQLVTALCQETCCSKERKKTLQERNSRKIYLYICSSDNITFFLTPVCFCHAETILKFDRKLSPFSITEEDYFKNLEAFTLSRETEPVTFNLLEKELLQLRTIVRHKVPLPFVTCESNFPGNIFKELCQPQKQPVENELSELQNCPKTLNSVISCLNMSKHLSHSCKYWNIVILKLNSNAFNFIKSGFKRKYNLCRKNGASFLIYSNLSEIVKFQKIIKVRKMINRSKYFKEIRRFFEHLLCEAKRINVFGDLLNSPLSRINNDDNQRKLKYFFNVLNIDSKNPKKQANFYNIPLKFSKDLSSHQINRKVENNFDKIHLQSENYSQRIPSQEKFSKHSKRKPFGKTRISHGSKSLSERFKYAPRTIKFASRFKRLHLINNTHDFKSNDKRTLLPKKQEHDISQKPDADETTSYYVNKQTNPNPIIKYLMPNIFFQRPQNSSSALSIPKTNGTILNNPHSLHSSLHRIVKHMVSFPKNEKPVEDTSQISSFKQKPTENEIFRDIHSILAAKDKYLPGMKYKSDNFSIRTLKMVEELPEDTKHLSITENVVNQENSSSEKTRILGSTVQTNVQTLYYNNESVYKLNETSNTSFLPNKDFTKSMTTLSGDTEDVLSKSFNNFSSVYKETPKIDSTIPANFILNFKEKPSSTGSRNISDFNSSMRKEYFESLDSRLKQLTESTNPSQPESTFKDISPIDSDVNQQMDSAIIHTENNSAKVSKALLNGTFFGKENINISVKEENIFGLKKFANNIPNNLQFPIPFNIGVLNVAVNEAKTNFEENTVNGLSDNFSTLTKPSTAESSDQPGYLLPTNTDDDAFIEQNISPGENQISTSTSEKENSLNTEEGLSTLPTEKQEIYFDYNDVEENYNSSEQYITTENVSELIDEPDQKNGIAETTKSFPNLIGSLDKSDADFFPETYATEELNTLNELSKENSFAVSLTSELSMTEPYEITSPNFKTMETNFIDSKEESLTTSNEYSVSFKNEGKILSSDDEVTNRVNVNDVYSTPNDSLSKLNSTTRVEIKEESFTTSNEYSVSFKNEGKILSSDDEVTNRVNVNDVYSTPIDSLSKLNSTTRVEIKEESFTTSNEYSVSFKNEEKILSSDDEVTNRVNVNDVYSTPNDSLSKLNDTTREEIKSFTHSVTLRDHSEISDAVPTEKSFTVENFNSVTNDAKTFSDSDVLKLTENNFDFQNEITTNALENDIKLSSDVSSGISMTDTKTTITTYSEASILDVSELTTSYIDTSSSMNSSENNSWGINDAHKDTEQEPFLPEDENKMFPTSKEPSVDIASVDVVTDILGRSGDTVSTENNEISMNEMPATTGYGLKSSVKTVSYQTNDIILIQEDLSSTAVSLTTTALNKDIKNLYPAIFATEADSVPTIDEADVSPREKVFTDFLEEETLERTDRDIESMDEDGLLIPSKEDDTILKKELELTSQIDTFSSSISSFQTTNTEVTELALTSIENSAEISTGKNLLLSTNYFSTLPNNRAIENVDNSNEISETSSALVLQSSNGYDLSLTESTEIATTNSENGRNTSESLPSDYGSLTTSEDDLFNTNGGINGYNLSMTENTDIVSTDSVNSNDAIDSLSSSYGSLIPEDDLFNTNDNVGSLTPEDDLFNTNDDIGSLTPEDGLFNTNGDLNGFNLSMTENTKIVSTDSENSEDAIDSLSSSYGSLTPEDDLFNTNDYIGSLTPEDVLFDTNGDLNGFNLSMTENTKIVSTDSENSKDAIDSLSSSYGSLTPEDNLFNTNDDIGSLTPEDVLFDTDGDLNGFNVSMTENTKIVSTDSENSEDVIDSLSSSYGSLIPEDDLFNTNDNLNGYNLSLTENTKVDTTDSENSYGASEASSSDNGTLNIEDDLFITKDDLQTNTESNFSLSSTDSLTIFNEIGKDSSTRSFDIAKPTTPNFLTSYFNSSFPDFPNGDSSTNEDEISTTSSEKDTPSTEYNLFEPNNSNTNMFVSDKDETSTEVLTTYDINTLISSDLSLNENDILDKDGASTYAENEIIRTEREISTSEDAAVDESMSEKNISDKTSKSSTSLDLSTDESKMAFSSSSELAFSSEFGLQDTPSIDTNIDSTSILSLGETSEIDKNERKAISTEFYSKTSLQDIPLNVDAEADIELKLNTSPETTSDFDLTDKSTAIVDKSKELSTGPILLDVSTTSSSETMFQTGETMTITSEKDSDAFSRDYLTPFATKSPEIYFESEVTFENPDLETTSTEKQATSLTNVFRKSSSPNLPPMTSSEANEPVVNSLPPADSTSLSAAEISTQPSSKTSAFYPTDGIKESFSLTIGSSQPTSLKTADSTEISRSQMSSSSTPMVSYETTLITTEATPIPFHFTIDADYDEVVGERKEEFEESLNKQLVVIMRIPFECLQNLQVSKGSVNVNFDLVPSSEHGYMADEKALRAAADELKRMIDNGQLNINDLDGNTLVVIPMDPPTKAPAVNQTEQTTLILGVIIGAFILTVISVAIAAIVIKRKAKGSQRLTPIEEMRSKLPSYSEIPFREALFMKGSSKDQLMLGKYCYHTGKWLGPGPEPLFYHPPESVVYRPPTDTEIRQTPRPPTAIRERLRNDWELDWDSMVFSR